MVRKVVHVKQGDPRGHVLAFIPAVWRTKNQPRGSQSVRSSVEAGQRPRSEGAQEGGSEQPMHMEEQPSEVPASEGRSKQGGEVRRGRLREQGPWWWTEPCVWTGRMLTALEQGVKGDRWFSLIDKVYSPRTLAASFERVRANGGAAGVDHQTIARFSEDLERNLERLSDSLRHGTFRPQEIRRVWIPKPGRNEKRPLGIPTVRDRVVQTALRSAIEPIFERDFAEQSYGFRPGRGCKDALRRVEELLGAGHVWVVDADLKGYFDTIPHDRLMERVRARIADGRVLDLIESFLRANVHETAGEEESGPDPDEGTPQGAVISPLLSNIYLDPLDHLMAERGVEMVRYADDFVILCRSEQDARAALAMVEEWVRKHGLTLHPEKTRVVDAGSGDGFDFLGYRFQHGRHWPSKKSQRRLKDAVRTMTGRMNGQSLRTTIAELNPVLRGWFEYFKHCRPWRYRWLDGWVRMRLRSILRHHNKGRGAGRGWDHRRWPNRFFAEHGLYSMSAAHVAARQSARR